MTAPLADRMRPQSLDDIAVSAPARFGQSLRNIIESGQIPN